MPEGTEVTLLDTLDERGKATRDGLDGATAWMLWTTAWMADRTRKKLTTAA